MEEFFILLIQGLFEFAINVLGNLPFDWPSRHRDKPEPESLGLPCFLWFCGGCVLAGVSLIIFRRTLLAWSASRLANLVFAPILSAYISKAIASRRAKVNPFIVPRNHFWQAFWFTLGLVLVRFAYASRA